MLAFHKVANIPESHRFEIELSSPLWLDLLRTSVSTPPLRPSQTLLKETAYQLALAFFGNGFVDSRNRWRTSRIGCRSNSVVMVYELYKRLYKGMSDQLCA